MRHLLMLHIDGGIKPPDGFVLPWPLSGKPGMTRINNAVAQWRGGELPIASAPATITVDLGRD